MGKKSATPGRTRGPKTASKSSAVKAPQGSEESVGAAPVKNSVGRPTKYLPELHVPQVYRLALLNLTDTEIASAMLISESTLNLWKSQHAEFSESMRKGKLEVDAEVANSLVRRAIGYEHPDVDIRVVDGRIVETPIVKIYPPDTRAAEFWLKNRQPHQFRERTSTEITGKDGGPIETVSGTMTDYAALRDKIKAKRGAE